MKRWELIFTGDIILDEPDPDFWLSGIAPCTRAADFTLGHLEVPHTLRRSEARGDVPAPGSRPEYLEALKRAGFSALTLAGNHISDCGPGGIEDTRAKLTELDIAHCGAGVDLIQAKAPLRVDLQGWRVSVLSYNCVGPEAGWAAIDRAGSAFVKIETSDGQAVAPAAPLTVPDRESLGAMREDILRARREADFLIVAFHKGILHTPSKLAPYERLVSHAAIDAGADVVLGHHAHIVRGIEFYRGKPIYHGLGNGCVVTRALSPDQEHRTRAAWAEKRKKMFGFEPDPAFYLAPFHPEARRSFLGRLIRQESGQVTVGFVPVTVEAPGRPTLATAEASKDVARYVGQITIDAGLPPLRLGALPEWTVLEEARA